jgi:hypothetical protein
LDRAARLRETGSFGRGLGCGLLAAVVTFALVLTAGSAHAQSFEPTVVRNPDDTVTYTVDFGGLPRGTSTMSASAPRTTTSSIR